MGNMPGQPLYNTNDCYATISLTDPPMTGSQIEILLNSPFGSNIFQRNSKIINNQSIPLEINKRWYFWDDFRNATSGNWNRCSVPLTPETWYYGNGSYAKTINFGCNLIETCCEASCCRMTATAQVVLMILFCFTMYLCIVIHIRLSQVVGLLTRDFQEPSAPHFVPSAPRLSQELRPATITSRRRQSPLYLQVPATDVQTPSVRSIPIPIPTTPTESSDEDLDFGEEEGEPPKYADLFPMP